MKTKLAIGFLIATALLWAGIYNLGKISTPKLGGDEIIEKKTIDEIIAEKPELELKADKEDVLSSKDVQEVKDGVVTTVKSYAYISDTIKPAQKLEYKGEELTEKIEDRLSNAEFYDTKEIDKDGNKIINGRFFARDVYYHENNEWKAIEYATTTIEAFEKQIEITPVEKVINYLFGETVYGACGDSGGTCNVTGGDGTLYTAGSASWNAEHDRTSSEYETQDYDRVQSFASGATRYIGRSFMTFDTSALPDTCTITAATITFHQIFAAPSDTDNDGNDYIGIVQTTADNPANLSTNDFNNCGSVDSPTLGGQLDLGSFTGTEWQAISLTATGMGWISKTATITQLGMREGHDIADDPIGDGLRCATKVGQSSSGYVPYLTITYTAGGSAAPVAPVISPIINFE